VSLLGSFGKAIVRGVTGFATGGIAGAAVGVATSFQGGGSRPGTSMVPYSPPSPGILDRPLFGGTAIGDALNAFPINIPGITSPQNVAAGGSCPRGYHLNKHPLAASKRHGAVPARTMCVRNRHMNPLNGRAVTRSLRRIKRARKLVAKLHAFGTTRSAARAGGRGHRAGCGCVVCRRR